MTETPAPPPTGGAHNPETYNGAPPGGPTNPTKPNPWKAAYDSVIGDRHPLLMLIIAVLILGVTMSATYHTAKLMLPWEMALVAAAIVCVNLFLIEAKYILADRPALRWAALPFLLAITVYAMWVEYYRWSTHDREIGEVASIAGQPHADLVAAIYGPKKAEAQRERNLAKDRYEAAEREKTQGTGTGRTGYGPRAQGLQREGDAHAARAAELEAVVAILQPYAEIDAATATPDEVYSAARNLWSMAPTDWKTGIPIPERSQFVDETRENPLLAPPRRALAGDVNARVMFGVALAVDGLALGLGLGIMRKKKSIDDRHLGQKLGDALDFAKVTRAHLVERAKQPVSVEAPVDPMRLMYVRVEGEIHAADFVSAVYRAIDPETGELDYALLRDHENESIRDSARWLMDSWRNPGWIVNPDDGQWVIPAEKYPQVTAFLRKVILDELDHRNAVQPDENRVERILKTVLPEPVKPSTDPVKLMRRRAAAAAPSATIAAPPQAAAPVLPPAPAPVPTPSFVVTPVEPAPHRPLVLATADPSYTAVAPQPLVRHRQVVTHEEPSTAHTSTDTAYATIDTGTAYPRQSLAVETTWGEDSVRTQPLDRPTLIPDPGATFVEAHPVVEDRVPTTYPPEPANDEDEDGPTLPGFRSPAPPVTPSTPSTPSTPTPPPTPVLDEPDPEPKAEPIEEPAEDPEPQDDHPDETPDEEPSMQPELFPPPLPTLPPIAEAAPTSPPPVVRTVDIRSLRRSTQSVETVSPAPTAGPKPATPPRAARPAPEPGQRRNVSLRTNLRSATREETQAGLTGTIDDALRVGTTLKVAYSTRPPTDVDTVGPMLRRHVTTMRAEAK